MKKNKVVNLTPEEAYTRYVEERSNPAAQDPFIVTLTLPTHRISPDYKQDALNLKNLIKQAEQELQDKVDKKALSAVVDQLKAVQEQIDHSHNLQGLVVYAGKECCSVVKLPVTLQPEVIIGRYYDIRPLLRARQQANNYYIITISREKIRLIEAANEQVILEFKDENFPFENTEYYTDSPIKLAQDDFTDRLIQEFFNQADKRFKYYLNENPLPVVLAGDVKNIPHYIKQMDNRCTYIGSIHGNYDTMPLHLLVGEAYPVVRDYIRSAENECVGYLEGSKSAALLTTDVNEIFRLTAEGNIDMLFMGKTFSLKGEPVQEVPGEKGSGTPEDLHGNEPAADLVNLAVTYGGTVVFLEDELLKPYSGIALGRRY